MSGIALSNRRQLWWNKLICESDFQAMNCSPPSLIYIFTQILPYTENVLKCERIWGGSDTLYHLEIHSIAADKTQTQIQDPAYERKKEIAQELQYGGTHVEKFRRSN